MAQQMTMFGKAATASFTAVRPSKAQRTSAVVVRAGAYDEETSSEAQAKSMMGKKALRIRRNSGLQIPNKSSGMQMNY